MLFQSDKPADNQTLDQLAERAAALIAGAGKIVVFTGAGVSTWRARLLVCRLSS